MEEWIIYVAGGTLRGVGGDIKRRENSKQDAANTGGGLS
jgi:hypothetical protein